MPVTSQEAPGLVDYVVVTAAATAVVVAAVWFALALRGRDSASDSAVKRRMLED
jgi:hypothetical protein